MIVEHGPDDYVRALGIREAGALPCSARSLTREEARTEDWKEAGWKLFVLAVFGLAMLWAYDESTDPDMGWWIIGCFAAVAACIGFLVWERLSSRPDYVDPMIEIEVAEARLIIRSPAGESSQPYEQLTVSGLLSSKAGGGRSFKGIVLDTAAGRLRLGDNWYANGEAAAGAILKRQEELGLTGPRRG